MSTNPLASPIREIKLGSVIITTKNDICQYEKIEFSESVFDLFPSGCLTVRDLDDVITFVKGMSSSPTGRTITIKYYTGPDETFYINAVNHLNNAASETEENFIGIYFTNKLYFINQNDSVPKLLESYKFPQVLNIETFMEEMVSEIKSKNSWASSTDTVALNRILSSSNKCSNVITYRPVNPLKEKNDEISDNPLQYMNYISSLACDSVTKLPRFLFWTGFNNEINFKYFKPNADGETIFRKYGVFQQDVPEIGSGSTLRKKIYVFTTSPAYQYLNRQYYYIRKTPKILNKPETTSTTSQETLLVNHQFLDDGNKYDMEIVTDTGVVNTLSGTAGYQSLDYTHHFGYFDQNDSFNQFKNSTLMGMEYNNRDSYKSKNLMTVSSPYPFVDNPEMWKNMWDLTPVHPDLSTSSSSTIDGPSTKLQKVYKIREDTKDLNIKSNLLEQIEVQNFVYYVLCCLKEPNIEEEETFFACITGWVPDPTNQKTGVNGEPLIYRYSWKRLGVELPDEITNFNNFTNPELNPWTQMSEGSSSNDQTYATWAININERKNYGGQNYYYGPGWFTENLNQPVFEDSVTYRPIGNPGGFLETEKSGGCYHIVMMRKIPYIQIILNAKNYEDVIGVDSDLLAQYIKAAKGKYLYCFELSNITDGECNEVS